MSISVDPSNLPHKTDEEKAREEEIVDFFMSTWNDPDPDWSEAAFNAHKSQGATPYSRPNYGI